MSSSYLGILMSTYGPGRVVAVGVCAVGMSGRSGVHAVHLDTDRRGGRGERYTGRGTGMQSIPQSGAALLSRRLETFRLSRRMDEMVSGMTSIP